MGARRARREKEGKERERIVANPENLLVEKCQVILIRQCLPVTLKTLGQWTRSLRRIPNITAAWTISICRPFGTHWVTMLRKVHMNCGGKRMHMYMKLYIEKTNSPDGVFLSTPACCRFLVAPSGTLRYCMLLPYVCTRIYITLAERIKQMREHTVNSI